MNDILSQVVFLVSAVERILQQVDSDPLSPTFGCAHQAYWRDKTSDFADMRRQEVMFPLALLYVNEYPHSDLRGDSRLKRAVEALLLFWSKNQYRDGSMDEWYKGERAFAVAAFSTHAVARTLELMATELPRETVDLSLERLRTVSRWLLGRNDLFKTNHQAVGVAALAWAGRVLDDSALTRGAYEKLRSILAVQTPEGWFPEIGRMDVGYTFLTVEFVAMAMDIWDDWNDVGPFIKAFDFACEWVHPDLTVSEHYGICHNTYLSRIAVMLFSRFSGRAAYLRQRLENESTGFDGYGGVLGDDLRLLRWSFQPLLAYEYSKKVHQDKAVSAEPIPLADPASGTLVCRGGSLVRFSCQGCTGVVSSVSGGLILLLGGQCGSSFSDYGYSLKTYGGYLTNFFYNGGTEIKLLNTSVEVVSSISLVKNFMPSFQARLALRAACSTATGSRLARKFIDVRRGKKVTAVNQSSAGIANPGSSSTLTRRITFDADGITVNDRISLSEKARTSDMYFLESCDKEWRVLRPVPHLLPDVPPETDFLEITKVYKAADKWFLEEISWRGR